MTKLFGTIMALAMSAAITGCSNGGFQISVSAPRCNNLMVTLVSETDSGLVIIDSAKVEMNKATINGSLEYPELMFLFMENAQDYLPIFVENSHIDVEANYAKLSKSVVSGSESNRIFTDFMQSYTVYSDKASRHYKMSQNANVYNDTIMMQHIETDMSLVRQESKEFQMQFVKKYIQHPIACYILATSLMQYLSPSEMRQIMDSIPADNRSNRYYAKVAKMAESVADTLL